MLLPNFCQVFKRANEVIVPHIWLYLRFLAMLHVRCVNNLVMFVVILCFKYNLFSY